MKRLTMWLMASLLLIGCVQQDKDEDIIIYVSSNNGLYAITSSDTTGNISLTADISESWLMVKNKNAEAVGVRVESSNSVIFSDSWISAGESATADNVNINYDINYTVSIRFYEGNILTIIVNLINIFGEENGWQQLDQVYIREEIIFFVKFISP